MNVDEILQQVRELPSGDYAEVGVWRGVGARRIAAAMDPAATLLLFDPLQGHREPGKHDLREYHPRGRYGDTDEHTIFTDMPTGRKLVFVQGYAPESLSTADGRQFRFVRIDVDHYEPTRATLEFFMPRMVVGGIIEFDDWTCAETPGAARAICEVLGIDHAVPYWKKETA